MIEETPEQRADRIAAGLTAPKDEAVVNIRPKGSPYGRLITEAASRHGVDEGVLTRLIRQESGFRPGAVSPKGARGLAQLMPGTAKMLGVTDPHDPVQAIDAGARYLSQQLKTFKGDYTKALAAYNAGPGAVQKYGGVPPYRETQDYVKRIGAPSKTLAGIRDRLSAPADESPEARADRIAASLKAVPTAPPPGIPRQPAVPPRQPQAPPRQGRAAPLAPQAAPTLFGGSLSGIPSAGELLNLQRTDGSYATIPKEPMRPGREEAREQKIVGGKTWDWQRGGKIRRRSGTDLLEETFMRNAAYGQQSLRNKVRDAQRKGALPMSPQVNTPDEERQLQALNKYALQYGNVIAPLSPMPNEEESSTQSRRAAVSKANAWKWGDFPKWLDKQGVKLTPYQREALKSLMPIRKLEYMAAPELQGNVAKDVLSNSLDAAIGALTGGSGFALKTLGKAAAGGALSGMAQEGIFQADKPGTLLDKGKAIGTQGVFGGALGLGGHLGMEVAGAGLGKALQAFRKGERVTAQTLTGQHIEGPVLSHSNGKVTLQAPNGAKVTVPEASVRPSPGGTTDQGGRLRPKPRPATETPQQRAQRLVAEAPVAPQRPKRDLDAEEAALLTEIRGGAPKVAGPVALVAAVPPKRTAPPGKTVQAKPRVTDPLDSGGWKRPQPDDKFEVAKDGPGWRVRFDDGREQSFGGNIKTAQQAVERARSTPSLRDEYAGKEIVHYSGDAAAVRREGFKPGKKTGMTRDFPGANHWGDDALYATSAAGDTAYWKAQIEDATGQSAFPVKGKWEPRDPLYVPLDRNGAAVSPPSLKARVAEIAGADASGTKLTRAIAQAAKEKGHDALVIRRGGGLGDELVIFEPQTVKWTGAAAPPVVREATPAPAGEPLPVRGEDASIREFDRNLREHPDRDNPNKWVPGKAPWDVRQKLWVELQPEAYQPGRADGHKRAVQQRLESGKPVPPEVLADYPDLQPKPSAPTPRQQDASLSAFAATVAADARKGGVWSEQRLREEYGRGRGLGAVKATDIATIRAKAAKLLADAPEAAAQFGARKEIPNPKRLSLPQGDPSKFASHERATPRPSGQSRPTWDADWAKEKDVDVLRVPGSDVVAVPTSGRKNAAHFDIINLKTREVVTQLKKGEVADWLAKRAESDGVKPTGRYDYDSGKFTREAQPTAPAARLQEPGVTDATTTGRVGVDPAQGRQPRGTAGTRKGRKERIFTSEDAGGEPGSWTFRDFDGNRRLQIKDGPELTPSETDDVIQVGLEVIGHRYSKGAAGLDELAREMGPERFDRALSRFDESDEIHEAVEAYFKRVDDDELDAASASLAETGQDPRSLMDRARHEGLTTKEGHKRLSLIEEQDSAAGGRADGFTRSDLETLYSHLNTPGRSERYYEYAGSKHSLKAMILDLQTIPKDAFGMDAARDAAGRAAERRRSAKVIGWKDGKPEIDLRTGDVVADGRSDYIVKKIDGPNLTVARISKGHISAPETVSLDPKATGYKRLGHTGRNLNDEARIARGEKIEKQASRATEADDLALSAPKSAAPKPTTPPRPAPAGLDLTEETSLTQAIRNAAMRGDKGASLAEIAEQVKKQGHDRNAVAKELQRLEGSGELRSEMRNGSRVYLPGQGTPKLTAKARAALDAAEAALVKDLRAAPKTLPGKGRSGATLSPDELGKYGKLAAIRVAKGVLTAADLAESLIRDLPAHAETIRENIDAIWAAARKHWDTDLREDFGEWPEKPATAPTPATVAPVSKERADEAVGATTPKAEPAATGIMNRRFEKQVETGELPRLPERVGGAKQGQSIVEGQKLIDSGVDPEDLAERLAKEGRPATGAEHGAMDIHAGMLEAQRKKIDGEPDSVDKLERLQKLEARAMAFLDNVQRSKTASSDSMRALQDGVTLDGGNYTKIIHRADLLVKKQGRKPLTVAEKKGFKDTADEINKLREEFEAFKAKVEADQQAVAAKEIGEAERQRTGGRRQANAQAARVRKLEAARELDDILKDLPRPTNVAAAGGAPQFETWHEYADLAKSAPKLAKATAKYLVAAGEELGWNTAAAIEETVRHLASKGIRATPQEVRDAYTEAFPIIKRTPAELEKARADFRADMLKNDELRKKLSGDLPLTAEEQGRLRKYTEETNQLRGDVELKKRAAEIEQQIAKLKTGPMVGPPRPKAEVAADIQKLITERDALRAEQRQAASEADVERQIRDLEARLKAGDFAADPKRRAPLNEKLAARRAELQALKTERLLAGRVEDLTAQLKGSTASPAIGPQMPPKVVSEKELNYRARIAMLERMQKGRLDALAPKTFMQRVGDVWRSPTAFVSSIDLSAPGRQGWLIGIANPDLAAKAFGEQMRSAWSPTKFAEAQLQLADRPEAVAFKRHGGFLADSGETLPGEEAFATRLFPKWTKFNPFAASERAYAGFLNRLRVDSFARMARIAKQSDEKTLKGIAHYVNASTGRGGSQKNIDQMMNGLSYAIFSPRYVYSRFEHALMTPLISHNSAGARKAIALEYAKTLGALAAFAMLAKANGFAVNMSDPNSADYMKLRKGDTRIDLLAGVQQAVVLAHRLATQKYTTRTGKKIDLTADKYGQMTADDVAWRFIRSKASPTASTIWSLRTKSDYIGDPFGPKEAVRDLFSPLSPREIVEGLTKDGWDEGDAWGLLNLLGISVNTYKDGAAKKPVDWDALFPSARSGEGQQPASGAPRSATVQKSP